MTKRFLSVLAVGLIAIGAGAFAEERKVPEARSQVMLSYAPLVKRVSPAVVNIYTKRVVTKSYSPFGGDPFFEQFFGNSFGGLNRQQLESSLGSGVILDKSGLVVTNAHVIKDAQEISVVLSDGREFDARVSIKDDRSDLAILRIDPKSEELPYVNLSASENLEVGDIVIAIGNPFGVGQTVTSGIVSALSRSSLSKRTQQLTLVILAGLWWRWMGRLLVSIQLFIPALADRLALALLSLLKWCKRF